MSSQLIEAANENEEVNVNEQCPAAIPHTFAAGEGRLQELMHPNADAHRTIQLCTGMFHSLQYCSKLFAFHQAYRERDARGVGCTSLDRIADP